MAGLSCKISISALALLVGCTEYFHDDFEDDTALAAPLEFPPGPPDGDQLVVLSNGTGIVQVENGIDGSHSPCGARARGGRTRPVAQANATTIPSDTQSRALHAHWSGIVSNALVSAEIYLVLSHQGAQTSVCHISIGDGVNDGTVYLNGNSIGTYTIQGVHHINLKYFPTNDTCVAVKTGSGESEGSRLEPAQSEILFPRDTYHLQFQLTEANFPVIRTELI